jgi:molybdopterin-biosynthesis enzyme MoeA-like protein
MSDAFGIIVVGDEILNGHRRDRHFDGIGEILRARGFAVAWLRILADDPAYLTAELHRTMSEQRPVFCCGGIGATPDDHTRQCAAAAAGTVLQRHPGATREIEERFGESAHPHRIKMADLPVGCELIPNPYNRVPGFSIRNHYFVPGFPKMAHPMASWVLNTYFPDGGKAVLQRAVRVFGVPESELMDLMQDLTQRFPQAALFSLPRLGEEYQIELGFRGVEDPVAPMRALTEALGARSIRFESLSDDRT